MRPASPVLKIASAPPRLSLRLSSMSAMESSDTSFFEIQTARLSVVKLRTGSVAYEEPVIEPPILEVPEQDAPAWAMESVVEPEEETQEREGEGKEDEPEYAPQSPPARNPRRISERPTLRLESPPQDSDDAGDSLYLLQPRTYTPLPPSPLPSPRVIDYSPLPSPRVHDYSPRVTNEQPKPRVESLSMASKASTQQREPLSPRFEQAQLRSQPSKPKLVAIGSRPEPRVSRVPEAKLGVPPEVPRAPEADLEMLPKQRTSLRQRVSLKTTPPESIQIPPPNALEMQRPMYTHSPRVYQAPDSAYGSDMERPPVNSIVTMNCSLAEFPTPPPRPKMVPSPHSDQQFFRPVQASPHSPLQQRPHTSGSSRPAHHQPPPRNIPSAMGMSMLSNVTTMSQQSGNSQALKKKRSAFGWLKKAFSLDEEERMAFEQKKSEQARNLYYDERSPKFLDGRRVQPQTYYAESYK